MLNICGGSIYKPLEIIFRACLEHMDLPQNSKKASVVPNHTKMTSNQ